MPEITRESAYALKSEFDSGLVLPAELTDGWASEMNENWEKIDTALKSNEDLADSNLSDAGVLNAPSAVVNQLVNPSFTIWQRGSPITGLPEKSDHSGDVGDYGPDQWQCYKPTSAGGVFVSADGAVGGGLVYNSTGSSLNGVVLVQRIERFLSFRGKTLTLSVDVRGEPITLCTIRLEDGVSITSSAIAPTSSFQRITITKNVDAAATKLVVRIILDGDSDCTIRRCVLAVADKPNGISYTPNAPGVDQRQCRRYFAHQEIQGILRHWDGSGGWKMPVRMEPKYLGGSASVTVDSSPAVPGWDINTERNLLQIGTIADGSINIDITSYAFEASLW